MEKSRAKGWYWCRRERYQGWVPMRWTGDCWTVPAVEGGMAIVAEPSKVGIRLEDAP